MFLPAFAAATPSERPCVRIYFDRTPAPQVYWMGRTYALFAQNLLGHFPAWQQIVSPIELYRAGDIETCAATLYFGSFFENAIPAAFYSDFAKTRKNVAWMGYSIWRYPIETQRELFGHEYVRLTTLDRERLDPRGRPTFFRDIIYKGEKFSKFGEDVALRPGDWRSEVEFRAGFEQSLLKPSPLPAQLEGVEVLAQAQHNGTGERIPYAIRKKNRFFVADIPFSFMHESDRMLVFADLLFDILGEKPRHDGKYAVVRLEDVHPGVPLYQLESLTRALEAEQVPVNISLIPMFFDPLSRAPRPIRDREFVTMDRHPPFMDFIRSQQKKRATFIWHGVTHQYGRHENPHNGITGADFEFWDAIRGRPVAEDSVDWVLGRLEDGWEVLRRAGLEPLIWLTPHYQASPLDYAIFARVFSWNMGRAVYYNHRLTGLPAARPEQPLTFSSQHATSAEARRQAFRGVHAEIEFDLWNGQMYPYEIYGDVHGQRLIPENLGNCQPFISAHVVRPRTATEIIADARRNRVLRDVWASFFYHPFLVQTRDLGGEGAFPGDPSELRHLVREIKALGYRFIHLEDWARANIHPIRPEPIVFDTFPHAPHGEAR